MTRTERLFVAIQPTEPVRTALTGLIGDIARARWTPPPQLHLTLRFIGEVSNEARQRIEEALDHVRVQPFFLGAEGTGRFPPRGHPSVVWAGVTGHPHLHQLRQQVDDGLLATGVPFELRPFVPHFTLARTGEASAGAVEHWLKQHRDFIGPAWRVNAFHLMASDLTPEGAGHRVLKTIALA
ncbi:MAG: 2-5 ligase [Rariglobus sp.]|jgi:2'-5' RNA ligase|nr:2-5 ligase [Rariglobus sp.]